MSTDNTTYPTGPADRPTELDSPGLFPPRGHYSHVTKHGGIAYISGQVAVTPDGGALNDRPFEDQVRQVLSNVDACLAAAGSSSDQLLQVTVYLVDIDNLPAFDGVYSQWLSGHEPTRIVTVPAALPYESQLQVSAIAIAG